MAILAGITRSVARAVIPKMFTGGFSATSALAHFRSIGGSIRTKTWYGDWREIVGMKKLERTYRFAPRKYRLSYDMMAKTESRQQYDYKYLFDVHGRDMTTGEYQVKTMSLGSDRRLSIEEAEEEYTHLIQAEMSSTGPEYGFEADFVELAVVTRK